MTTPLLGLYRDELRDLVQQEGERSFRGTQIAGWLYREGAHMFEEMTNLPDAFRAHLAEKYSVGRSELLVRSDSPDGTVKLLLALYDGARIETVGLPYSDRMSCCVSTQVGCPVGCVFCATGLSGFSRNLAAGEIVDQVLTVQEMIRSMPTIREESHRRVDHVTFMGMGEPLLSYAATVKAARLLNVEMGIAMRNITISTAGVVPGMHRLADEHLQLTLAVSLHAPWDDLRRRLMPGMTRWNVDDIIAACRYYVDQTGRRVTFEYCLIEGMNDAPEDARGLAQLLRGLNCHVNLIPFNAVQGLKFRSPSRERVTAFRDLLRGAGIQVTQRVQRGSRIDAACGQLRRQTSGASAAASRPRN